MPLKNLEFLPVSRADMDRLGWDRADFILITGDAYVDHPSFGAALIGRVLESKGFRVAIMPQPDVRADDDFRKLGTPRLGFLVTSGNIDSMVNRYTAAKKPRKEDLYSPGGKPGRRPDRALTVYARIVRRLFPDSAVILGGLEASLRRFAHYDYWSDSVMPSVLADSGADLLVYGMGERAITAAAEALRDGAPVQNLTDIPGTVYRSPVPPGPPAVLLPSFEEVRTAKRKYAESFAIQYRNMDALTAKPLAEGYDGFWVVSNPPAAPLSREELDKVYELPFTRTYHPMYAAQGGVPALAEVKFGIVSNRGCFGGCNFCALAFHQGRSVRSRSHDSVIREAESLTRDPEFKGYIHDVGGPTANFKQPACKKQESRGVCPRRLCLFPTPCKELRVDHEDFITLLRKLRRLPGVKKVFVRSGLRFDYLMLEKDPSVLRELCEHHISGQLKVAPEHVSDKVLRYMGKPPHRVYESFVRRYRQINAQLGKKQYLVPYLMSGHPGCDLKDAVALAEWLHAGGYTPEQVQDFYPTPGTLSTCMFYTEIDPFTGEPVYVAKDPKEKAMQRALIQYKNPKNRRLVTDALIAAGRTDLIGYGKQCLVPPPPGWAPKTPVKKDPPRKKTNKKLGTRWDGPSRNPRRGGR